MQEFNHLSGMTEMGSLMTTQEIGGIIEAYPKVTERE